MQHAFPASAAGRTVLVVDFNPEPAAQGVPFDTAASYELKIDIDGDAEADTTPPACSVRAHGATARKRPGFE